MMTDIAQMRQNWLQVACQWKASKELAIEVFDFLVKYYSAKRRHYHTLTHVEHLLSLMDEYRQQLHCWQSVYFAIWFHDAVQNSFGDNEGNSKVLADKELARLNVPADIIARVGNMILATKAHQPSDDNDTNFMLDFDLAILAANEQEYSQYAKDCRKEYKVPDFLFNSGRAKFIKSKLAQPFVFNSAIFRQQFEQMARDNLSRELKSL